MWSKAGLAAIRSLPLPPYSTERRDALVDLYLQLQEEIDELDKTVAECAAERERARLLMTYPGVGPITHWPRRVSSAILRDSPMERRWPVTSA